MQNYKLDSEVKKQSWLSYLVSGFIEFYDLLLFPNFKEVNNTGQQNLPFFFLAHELQNVNLAVLFVLNSDMYTEFFYQAEFER